MTSPKRNMNTLQKKFYLTIRWSGAQGAAKALTRIFALLCTALFFFHGISASLFLLGFLPYSPRYKSTGWILAGLIIFHALIVAAEAARNLYLRRTGVLKGRLYVRQNISFFGQRLSGALLLVFILLHIGAYGYTDASGFHLRHFGIFSLVNQTALAALAGIHLMSSARPLVISLGIDSAKGPGRAIVAGLLALIAFSVLISFWAALSYYASFSGR